MAVSISFTGDWSQLNQETAKVASNLSAAFAGIQSQMKAMETASTSATSKMVTGLQQMAAELKPAVFGLNTLGVSMLKTGQAAGATTTQLQKFARQSQDTAKASEQAAESQKKFGSAITGTVSGLRSLAAGFGLLLGAQGLITFVKSLVDAGLQMERFERTLTAATGSTRGAADAWRFITAESNRLGQSVEAMVPIFVQLTAATRNTVLEGERTRELFSALAGAGQAVGLSTEAVGGAMLGLTQIISQNAIQLDEFRNQFASRIPGAMLETAKALKVLGVTSQGTIAEMLKGFERGTITIPQFTQAVTMALKEIQRTAPEMGNTAAAAFTQLGNAAFQLKADLARSGLLEFMTNMAQTARGLLARVREALGTGGRDFLGQVSDIQGQLSKLRQQRQELQEEAPRSNLESTLRLEGLLGTTQAERLKKLNEEIGLQEEKLRVIQQTHKTETDAESEKARLTQKRLDDEAAATKKADDAAKRSREGAQDAAARARAQVGLTSERVQQEKIALDQIQALRAQALEQDYEMAVANTAQTKAAQENIETAFAIRRLDSLKQAALEDAALQEKTAIQTRDTRIAAIKAVDAAAQAAATDPKATAEAQVTASKRSAAAVIELQTVTLNAQNSIQEAVKKRTEAEAAYEKGVSAVVKGERADQIKITEAQLQREAQMRQQALQGQASILNAETALVQAKVDGLVLTEAEGLTQRQDLERQALDVRRMLLEESFQNELRLLNEKVKANQATQDDITAIQTQHTKDLQVINLEQQTQTQVHQNELLKDWREWVKDVRRALGDFLFRWMDGQVRSIKDVLLDLKSYFFRLIADMIAYAASKAIIIPIVTAVIGGIGGGGALGQAAGAAGLLGQLFGAGGGSGGGLLGSAGTALSGLGLARNLMSYLGLDPLTGMIGNGLSALKETLMVGFKDLFQSASTQAAQAAAENATAASELGFETTGQVGTGAAGAGVSTAATVMGIAGGLAALGAGIYGALNASNNAAKAAYAASAAAGAAAATSAALVSAGVIAAGTGWTGVGLIAAAAAAVIGTVLNMVLKPAGPNLAVGQPAGVGVGVEGGKLVRRGGATSNIIREEGVSPEQTSGVQKALNAGINAAVDSIVQTINAVALDPAKLLGPTQDALRFALSEVQTINSASARHMEKDIAEQLKFTQTAIVSNMLEPINLAFEQLIDSDLETQLNRLPGTTTGLVDIFKTLNTQLDEMAKGENRDVLGQIQGVREAVARFGNRLAQTAGRTAEQIVNGVIDEFTTMTTTLPALHELSDAGQFSENLGTFITALNEAMSGGLQALATLKKTQETLTAVGLSGEAVGAQVGRLITAIGEQSAQLSEQIVTMMTMTISELKGSADPGQFSQNLGTFITTLNTMVSGSLQALATLKATQQTLESFGLSGAAVGAQVGRLITMIGEQSAKLSEQIVIGSLKNLADALQTVVVQPIRIQATTVDSLFTDSLAALNELWLEMQRLDQVGIDTTRIKEQFTTLLGGVLESAKSLLTAAVQQGTFPEFLDVLLSIPDALAKLNPVFERLKALGQAFASVVGPNQQAIAQGEEQLRTPAERMAHTAEQMHDLELAIADAGTSAEKALPLYAQLGQAIQANAAAQIAAVQQVGAVIEQITSILETRRTTSERLAQINQRINTAPGGGQGSMENISQLVTLYGQQLDLLAQLMDTIDAGLSSIDETLRADESVSMRAARLVGATAQPPEVPGKVRALTAEELLQQAGALQDAIGAVRELIAVIEQGLQNIQDILHANETINERAGRLMQEVTTGPQPQTVEGLIQLSTGLGDALGAIRALIDLIEQGLQQIQDIMHANETATQRAIRLVAAVPSAQGVTDAAALISMAGQIGEAITAVRAVIDLLQSGIDSIDSTLFSLLSVAEKAADIQAKIAAVNQHIASTGQATPEQLIKLVGLTQQALALQQQITQALESTLDDLKASIEDTGTPANTIAQTRAEIAPLQALAEAGTATPEQLQTLVDLNQKLLGLGVQFDLLDVQQEALDSLKALAPMIQQQIDDSKLREQALVDNLVLIKTTLESYLTVAQSTEAQLLTQLAGIQTALQVALAVAVSTETWLITQLTVIQQWLEAALIGAKVTEQQLVLQLLGVQAILQAQRAELAIAQAITIRYLDAQLKMLNDQLLAQYGTANVDLIIKQIQEWQLDELRDLNTRLKDLFFQQPAAIDLFGVQTAIGTQTTELQTGHLKSIDDQTGTVINKLDDIFKALDKPLVTVPKMQGGFIALQMGGPVDHASLNHAMTGPLHLARGGMVAAILEPGEHVFPPPFSPSQTHALTSMNTAFPRMAGGGWTVPGSGSGDHVPAMLPSGSFVLNRRASRAAGYQAGGPVQGSVSTNHVTINIQVYQQPGQSGRELVQEITKQLRREFRTKNDDSPFR